MSDPLIDQKREQYRQLNTFVREALLDLLGDGCDETDLSMKQASRKSPFAAMRMVCDGVPYDIVVLPADDACDMTGFLGIHPSLLRYYRAQIDEMCKSNPKLEGLSDWLNVLADYLVDFHGINALLNEGPGLYQVRVKRTAAGAEDGFADIRVTALSSKEAEAQAIEAAPDYDFHVSPAGDDAEYTVEETEKVEHDFSELKE
jgi:hypothetical protein